MPASIPMTVLPGALIGLLVVAAIANSVVAPTDPTGSADAPASDEPASDPPAPCQPAPASIPAGESTGAATNSPVVAPTVAPKPTATLAEMEFLIQGNAQILFQPTTAVPNENPGYAFFKLLITRSPACPNPSQGTYKAVLARKVTQYHDGTGWSSPLHVAVQGDEADTLYEAVESLMKVVAEVLHTYQSRMMPPMQGQSMSAVGGGRVDVALVPGPPPVVTNGQRPQRPEGAFQAV